MCLAEENWFAKTIAKWKRNSFTNAWIGRLVEGYGKEVWAPKFTLKYRTPKQNRHSPKIHVKMYKETEQKRRDLRMVSYTWLDKHKHNREWKRNRMRASGWGGSLEYTKRTIQYGIYYCFNLLICFERNSPNGFSSVWVIQVKYKMTHTKQSISDSLSLPLAGVLVKLSVWNHTKHTFTWTFSLEHEITILFDFMRQQNKYQLYTCTTKYKYYKQ